jgi:hypothetical protein
MQILYITLFLTVFLTLSYDKTLSVNLLTSIVFNDEFTEKNKFLVKLIACILAPITFIKILIIKFNEWTWSYETDVTLKQIKIKNMKKILIIVAIATALIFGGFHLTQNEVNYYNQSVNTELQFNKAISQRLTIIDRITKIVHQKLEIAKINDSSYYKDLAIIATSRADKEQLFMKWVTENNPNANYSEVAALYKDVSASIEAERNQLQAIESTCQEYVYEYEKLHKEIPSSWYLYYQKSKLNYEPISTTTNKVVNKTGVDNNINM